MLTCNIAKRVSGVSQSSSPASAFLTWDMDAARKPFQAILRAVTSYYKKTSRVKRYLIKQNRKTVDFVLFEQDDKFVRKTTGQIGKSGIGNSTLNAGSPDKAIKEIINQINDYSAKGYIDTDLPKDLITKDIVFDKAEWHINKDFPKGVNQFQSYIHTGFFICWLIINDLIESDFKNDNQKGIELLFTRQITPSSFYADYLDGIFSSDGLTQEAIKFTSDYFDFERGQYIHDYISILDPLNDLPTMFHITDSWDNYDKLKNNIDKRYLEWKTNNSW